MSIINNHQYGITRVNVSEFSYTWTIENFKFLHRKVGECIKSPIFTNGNNHEYRWEIVIHVNGVNENFKDYLSLRLGLHDTGAPENSTLMRIALIDQAGKEFAKVESFFCIKHLYDIEKRSFDKFVKRDDIFDEKNNLLPNGNLTIRCEMYFENDIISVNKLSHKPSSTTADEKRINNFEHLLENEKFSDIKLIVGNKEFHVYKGILAAQSPVFSAMFEHNMKETNENSVVIPDINHEVMQEVLRFIYAGKIKNIQKVGINLLVAADKYQLEELKTLCEQELINYLSVDNIGEILVLVDRCKTDILKSAAMKFFTLNAKNIINTEKFAVYMKNVTPMFFEILKNLVSNL